MNENAVKFFARLQERDDVLGILMFGSWARGNNDPASDIDLVVLLKEGYERKVEYEGSQAFEIIYTTPTGAREFWENNLDDTADLWSVAKIIFERDGALEKLKGEIRELLAKGKSPLTHIAIERLHFDIEDSLRGCKRIAKKDIATANLVLSMKVFQLSALFFDLRHLWSPAPKQRLQEIQKIDPEQHEFFSAFYTEEMVFESKVELVRKITDCVFRPSH